MLRTEVITKSCNITSEHSFWTFLVLREQHSHGNQFDGSEGLDTCIPSISERGRIFFNKLIEEGEDFSKMRLRLGAE